MIPLAYIQAWSHHAPWPQLSQIEQDLIICRALCEIFSDPFLKERIAFRGGTAIQKLLFDKPMRYSEDIDLVQLNKEPVGETGKAIQRVLSPWLGKRTFSQAKHSQHWVFNFIPEDNPNAQLKLKIEMNTREHSSYLPLKPYTFEVKNGWYTGKTEILSYETEELFGTKLRALLQRKKNRDLFDLHMGLTKIDLDTEKVLQALNHYLQLEETVITRAMAEEAMLKKLFSDLTQDIAPLLTPEIQFSQIEALDAFKEVWIKLITEIPGDPWKSSEKVIEQIRKQYPDFLP